MTLISSHRKRRSWCLSSNLSLTVGLSIQDEVVLASHHLLLHACSRSLFARELSIDSRAYVINQHTRWPIRTVPRNCANQDAWMVIVSKLPKANSIHTATWHAWTRTPRLNSAQKAIFFLIHFPAFGRRAILIWGIETWLLAVPRTKNRIPYKAMDIALSVPQRTHHHADVI